MNTKRSTGIIRRIDELGRVVIPREIRNRIDIREGDPFELFTDNEGVYFKKYNPGSGLVERVNRLMQEIKDNEEIGNDTRREVIESLRKIIETLAKN